jgi:hypothetical protein
MHFPPLPRLSVFNERQANYLARDTFRLGATLEVEHSHVKFLGNLVLNLWDCGGYVEGSPTSVCVCVCVYVCVMSPVSCSPQNTFT